MRKVSPKRRKTFRQILNKVAPQNARRMMERARIANQLAKSLRGRSRANAYAIKTEALLGLSKKFPQHVMILRDARIPEYVLVRIAVSRFAFHAPARSFTMSRAA
jgi:hypothetical protein